MAYKDMEHPIIVVCNHTKYHHSLVMAYKDMEHSIIVVSNHTKYHHSLVMAYNVTVSNQKSIITHW